MFVVYVMMMMIIDVKQVNGVYITVICHKRSVRCRWL